MKRIISLILAFTLILSICSFSVIAADNQTVSAENLQVEIAENTTFDYPISISNNKGIISIKIKTAFDNTIFELTKIQIGEIMPNNGTNTGKNGITSMNNKGEITVVVGNDTAEEDYTDNGVLVTLSFKLKDDAAPGKYDFSMTATEAKNFDMDTVTTDCVSGSVTLYSILNSADISLATPTKNGTPQATVTGTGYTGDVNWSPAVTNNKFAANTAYTATAVLTAQTGYQFGENFAVDGYTVSNKSVSSVTLTKNFAKTEDKVVTGIEVTTAPTKTVYEHGDTLDTAGMVVTATYDDESTAVVTDYTVTYSNGNYLKKDDTTTTVNFGGKTASVTALSVGTKKLTVTGLTATNRTYNGTNSVALTGGSISGVINGETVTANFPENGTVETADAATGKAVTYGDITLSGDDANNYTIEKPTLTVDITPKTISDDMITLGTQAVYDGNEKNVSITSVKDGDADVTYNVKSGNKATNVGNNTLTIEGTGNYTGTATAAWTLQKATLTADDFNIPSLEEKEYNGNAVEVDVPTLKGEKTGAGNVIVKYNGETTAPTAKGEYTVTFDVAEGDNYSAANGLSIGTLKINAKNVTENRGATDITVVKNVGSFTDPTFGEVTGDLGYSYDGAMTKDAIVAKLAALSKDATGTITYTYTATGNYTGTITGSLSFTIVDVAFELADGAVTEKENPVYGDKWNDIVKLNPAKITAKVGDNVSTSAAYTVQNGGETPVHGEQTYTVLFSGVIDGRNYENAIVKTGTVTIAQKPITITGVTAENRTYNGETSVTLNGGTLNGVLAEDTVNVTLNAGTIDKNAGSNKIVTTNITIDNENYALTQPTVTVTITPAALTITGVKATDRAYDGTTSVVLSSGQLNGVLDGDNVNVTLGNGTVGSKNAGENKAVTTNITIDNPNYTLTQPTDVTVTISPKTITISGVNATDRTYDGTDTVALTGGALNDVVSGDTVRFTLGSGTVDKNKGENKTVTTNITLNNANYVLTQPTDVKVNISAKELKVTGAKATDREYDGTDVVVLTDGVLTGVVSGETVTLENAKGTIDDKNVGSGKNVTAAYTLGGKDKDNYTLTQPTGIKVRITEKALTVVNPAATERKYDGTVNVDLTAAGLEGVVGTEKVTIKTGAKGTVSDAKVGDNKAVTTAYELDGDDMANYKVTQPENVKVNITKADRDLKVDNVIVLLHPGSKKADITATIETDLDKSAVVSYVFTSDIASVSLSGKIITIEGISNGTATLTVKVEETDNYNAATEKTVTVRSVMEPVNDINITKGEYDEITALLDGNVIKLSGVAEDKDKISADVVADTSMFDKTIEDDTITLKLKNSDIVVKTYTIDKSGVVVKAADVDLGVKSEVTRPTDSSLDSVTFGNETKAENIIAAASKELNDIAEKSKKDGVTKVEVDLTLTIEPKFYDSEDKTMTIGVTPTYVVKITDGEGTTTQDPVELKSVTGKIKISVKLPEGFVPTVAKLIHSARDFEFVPVSVADGVASWEQNRFSDVELIEGKTLSISYTFFNETEKTVPYKMTDIGSALEIDERSGYNFNGWVITADGVELDGKFKTLTEELFNTLSVASEITAEPDFSAANSGGSYVAPAKTVVVKNSENGRVSVDKDTAKSGDTVVLTINPADGYILKSLSVKDKDGNEVAVTRSLMTSKFTMPAGKVTVEAEFEKAPEFVDVVSGSFYEKAVDWAVLNSITNGVDVTHFAPDASCTRAQAVTFLWRALGCPEPKVAKSEFADVTDANAFYYKAVLWAAENGVTLGYDDGRFGVDDTVNRGQMVTFMERAMKGKATTAENFVDVPEGAFYADAAAWAKENGVSTGIGNNKFGGEIDCLRAQIVTMLYRYFVK